MQFCHNPRFVAQNGKWPTRLKKAQAYELDWRRDSAQEILFLSLTKACDEKRIYITEGIDGFMRFDADSLEALTDLLKHHPTVVHGGTIEICEMPKT
jgi:hypothetical protein